MSTVLLDPRDGEKRNSGDLLPDLRKLVNCPVEYETLDAGDVLFTGSGPDNKEVLVAIELKTISDFLSSMRTNKLAEQVGKMFDAYEYNYLVIQGIWRPNDQGVIEVPHREKGKTVWAPLAPISRDQLKKGQRRHATYTYQEMQKHIMSLELKRGLVVKYARSRQELLLLLSMVIHAWWQKPWDSHASADAIKLQPTGIRYKRASTLRLVASQIPSIGAGRSAEVARAFQTVFAMANAPVSEWETIKGIGKGTALKAFSAIRSKE